MLPIQLSITVSSMATAPKTTKNAETATASRKTCTAWATTSASTRLALSSPTTSESSARSVAALGQAAGGVLERRAGAGATTASASSRSSTSSSSSPSRETRKKTAARPKKSTEPPSTPALSASATCHTSVLMNRKVMKSSSIGSARVASGTSRPRLPSARPPAQRAIVAVCSARSA